MEHYRRDDVVAKYVTKTAGAGIDHVLANVYGPIYLRVIDELIAKRSKEHRFRVLEYGCGGGMNLLKLVDLLRSAGAQLDKGYGADFSPPMVEAATVLARQKGIAPARIHADAFYTQPT